MAQSHVLAWLHRVCAMLPVQALAPEMGTVFMAGLDTTPERLRLVRIVVVMVSVTSLTRHMSGAALAPVLRAEHGDERQVHHLTAELQLGLVTRGVNPRGRLRERTQVEHSLTRCRTTTRCR